MISCCIGRCDSMPEQKGIFVTKYELTDEEYAKMWEDSKNNLGRIEPDEQLKELGLITEKGEYVRSKSEKIIADTLTKNNINYVYELPLRLKGYGTVKPDFTVLNKRTRHEYVWEHFGMMDDSIYVKNAIKKIEQYGKSGYVQGKNFIATFESKEAPLNTVTINRVIQDFFQQRKQINKMNIRHNKILNMKMLQKIRIIKQQKITNKNSV